MLKEKDLQNFVEPRAYEATADVPVLDLEFCRDIISEQARKFDVPIVIHVEQIKIGGMFSKEVEECLEISHPEHPRDYFRLLFRLQKRGIMQTIRIDYHGTSPQMKKHNIAEAYAKDRHEQWKYGNRKIGEALAYSLGSKIASGIRSFGKSKVKLEREQEWYDMVVSILNLF